MLFIDYAPLNDCKNENSYGEICVKCNRCGRFSENAEVQKKLGEILKKEN